MRTVPFVLPLLLAGAVAYYGWELWRSRTLLARWAVRKGVEIIWARRRWVFKGPFFWKSTSGQVVFRVKVRDLQGYERTGWVLCGNYVTGMVTEQTSEIWDKGIEPVPKDEFARDAGSSASPQNYAVEGAVLKWAVRSPLRMILVLVGALLALLVMASIRYWIHF